MSACREYPSPRPGFTHSLLGPPCLEQRCWGRRGPALRLHPETKALRMRTKTMASPACHTTPESVLGSEGGPWQACTPPSFAQHPT